jgi:hypothetical protein
MNLVRRWIIGAVIGYAIGIAGWCLTHSLRDKFGMGEVIGAWAVIVVAIGGSVCALAYVLGNSRPSLPKTDSPD